MMVLVFARNASDQAVTACSYRGWLLNQRYMYIVFKVWYIVLKSNYEIANVFLINNAALFVNLNQTVLSHISLVLDEPIHITILQLHSSSLSAYIH